MGNITKCKHPNNPKLVRTPVAPLLEREGLASTAALHRASITIPFHRWTPRKRTSSVIASRCQCSCLPRPRATFSPVHLYAGSWNAVTADHFVEQMAIKIGTGGLKAILNTSSIMNELFPSYLLIFLTHMIIATLQICQVVPARRCTSRKVWSDAKLMKMTASVSVQHLQNVPTPSIQRVMSSTTYIMDKWLQRLSMCQTPWLLVGHQWILWNIWNEVAKLVTMSFST